MAKEKKAKSRVYVEKGRGYVDIAKDKSVRGYGSVGGDPPSRQNPKGERRVEGGVEYRFGGSKKDAPNKSDKKK